MNRDNDHRPTPAAGPEDPQRPPRRRRPSTRKSRPRRRGYGQGIRVIIWLLALILIGGGGYVAWRNYQPDELDGDFAIDESAAVVEETMAGDRAVVVVFPEWDAMGYVTEQRQIPSRDRAGEDLLGVMRTLCEGPRISGAVSALPEGTQALAAFYNSEKMSAVLDFSQELVTGHPGGSTAEAATLTSILRTVALNFPQTRSCTILVDGAEVETLSGHLFMNHSFDPRRWL